MQQIAHTNTFKQQRGKEKYKTNIIPSISELISETTEQPSKREVSKSKNK